MQMPVVLLGAKTLALAFVLTIAVFGVLLLSPGGLVGAYVSPDAPAAESAAAMKAIGPFKPVYVQYVGWLGRLARGDFGWSASNHEPVSQVLVERLPATIELVACSLTCAILLGALGGALRLRAGTLALGRLFAVLELIVRSAPISLFAPLTVMLGLIVPGLPTAGIASAGAFDLVDRLRHLVSPALTIALPLGAWASFVFYETWRKSSNAAGNGGRASWRRDVVRSSAVCVSMLGPAAIAGALFVEPAYGWPGVGRVFPYAFTERDAALIAGLVIAFGFTVLALKVVAQLSLLVFGDGVADLNAAPVDRVRRTSFFSKPIAVAGLVLICLLGVLGLAANLIAPTGPHLIDQAHWQGYPLAPGIGGHILGTDENGRDLLARLLFALRTSLAIAIGAALVATTAGLLIAAVKQGLRIAVASDAGTAALCGIRAFGALPFILVAVVCVLMHVMSPLADVLMIGIASWPAIAAVAQGSWSVRTIGAAAVGVAGAALLLEVTLSNRGFAVPPPAPTLGNLLMNAQSNLTVAPWTVAFPILVIMVALFALYAISDSLRES